MKRLFYPPPIRLLLMVIMLLLAGNTFLHAEGSVDFRNYPGHRLFYNVEQDQQLKIYAAAGETINVASSHVAINGGTIEVYNPSGQLVATFDGSDALTGIIFNSNEELAGPVGSSGGGFTPGVVPVPTGQGGVWSIRLRYPNPRRQAFTSSLLNSSPWTRTAHQPNFGSNDQRVALAWDVTVTQGGAGNAGGTAVQGRLYSNEYISILDGNGRSTSPTFYILTKAGYLYKVDFSETDPWGFPIHSNSLGITTGDFGPTYMSAADSVGSFFRSDNTSTWNSNTNYLYAPQAEDSGPIINNKVFFNLPDTNMPTSALVTDISSRNKTHTTWLYNTVPTVEGSSRPFTFTGVLPENGPCQGDLVAEEGAGGNFVFDTELAGQATLQLDLNNNGSFNDAEDVTLRKNVDIGSDAIFWDGRNGLGTIIQANPTFAFNFNLTIRGGEVHLLLSDIENNIGGVTFSRINGPGSPDDRFYYDHSGINGGVSGGGSPGNPNPTTSPFTYSAEFGDEVMLDQWAFIETNNFGNGILTIAIEEDCAPGDHDNDGIPDIVDIDDDNDGVPDLLEYCHPDEGFACLPNGLDPSGDEDSDGVQNYQDANDPAVNNGCSDGNNDGVCDQIAAIYDTDGDNVPDHFDLDSDNDGITDLDEAGHGQTDVNRDGIIDGAPAVFGANGLFSGLETNDSPTGVANYTPFDVDGDGIPDHDDLDSDNDGILDVVEAGYVSLDSNQDGRIDDGNGNIPSISVNGIPSAVITVNGVPFPPDWDSDGVADWRDLDSDNDGILDVIEGGYQGNDTNGDGRIDDGNGNIPNVNSDGLPPVMATGNPITLPPDTDNDGVRDWHDLDSDNDGINDTVENKNPDGDGDGFIGTGPITVDANGIATADANGGITPFTPLVNTDGTGSADFRDLDADGDGINDVIEGGLSDPDNDGIIGSGTPAVNVFGQATEGTTSNPPDTDNDGTPDFQQVIDNSCENPATPSITVSASSLCAGESITFTASGVTDTDVSYVWTAVSANTTAQFTTSEPTLTINPTTVENTGTYTVVATRDTCSSAASNGLSVVVNPVPAAPSLSASATSVCEGGAVTLSVNAAVDPNITYRWILTNGGASTVVTTTTEPSLVINPIAISQAGTYTVEALGGGGICPGAASNGVAIAVSPTPAAPVLTASSTNICEGESVTLTVSGNTDPNVSYVWTAINANGTAEFTTNVPTLTFNPVSASNAATYTVVAIGGGGVCPSGASNSVSLSVIPAASTLTLSSTASSLCEGEAVTLTASGEVDANTTYQWVLTLADGSSSVVATTSDPSLTLDPITATQSGTYTVEALGGGGGVCPTSGPSNGVAIAVTPKPAPPVVTTDQSIFCEGQRLEFMTTPVPGDNVIYEWTFTNTDGRTDPLITSSQPSAVIEGLVAQNTGTYQVRAIVNGCPSDFSEGLEIDVASGGLPDVVASSSAPIESPACEGDNVSLSVTDVDGASFSWTGPNGFTSDEQNPVIENATSAANGEYTVSVTVNACEKVLDPVTVQVDPKPATPTITASETMVCAGEGFTLSTATVAGDNISYDWSLGGTVLVNTTTPELIIAAATVAEAGSYTVVVNNGGCPSDPSDPVEITVTPPLEGVITMEPMGGVCEGESVSLTAPSADGATYAWTGPDGFTSTDATINLENVSAASNGDYEVTVTVNGCPTDFGPVTLQINPKPATPTISSDKSAVCPGDGVTLSTLAATGEAISYDWLLDGNLVANTQDPELVILDFQAANAGDYIVVVKDGSCPSDASDPVTVSLQENLEGVSASSNSPVCIGDDLNLMVTDVEGATFVWTGPNDFTSTEQNPVIMAATADDAGDYTVVVTIDGCPATIPPTTVEVTPKPDAPTVSISDGPVCEGIAGTITVADPQDNITYTVMAEDGSTVASSDMGVIEIPTDGMAGTNTYTVVAQEAGGCPSEPSNAVSLEVTAKPDEEAMIMDPDMGDGCSGAPDMIEAVAPTQGTGMWSSSNTAVVFADPTNPTTGVTGLQDGDMVTWTLSNEACGEYSSETITINAMDIEVTANNDSYNVTQPGTITSENILSNDSPSNVTVTVISGSSNGTANITPNGILDYTPNSGFAGSDQITYQICSTDCPDICDQATINIEVMGNLTCVVPDVITPNNDNVNDAFVIECSDFKNVGVKIFNRWGDKVYESNNYRSDWMGTHEGNPLPPGPYYYIFEEEGVEAVTGCVSIVR